MNMELLAGGFAVASPVAVTLLKRLFRIDTITDPQLRDAVSAMLSFLVVILGWLIAVLLTGTWHYPLLDDDFKLWGLLWAIQQGVYYTSRATK